MLVKPSITKDYENDGTLYFIIKDVPTCVVNAIRRTILSEIPVVVIKTETSSINKCIIEYNTSRFHNEIVKQRLSSIPFIVKEKKEFVKNYYLTLDVDNKSSYETLYVTSDDFVIENKNDSTKLDIKTIVPHDSITNEPIEFLRLRPKIGNLSGEKIKLSASFDISNAKENGMFNCVSKCTYHNVIDAESRESYWKILETKYKSEGLSADEIDFEYKNFINLDGYRSFKIDNNGNPNEFEFNIKTIGQYTNYELVSEACKILIHKFSSLIENLKSGTIPIHNSMESKTLGYTSVTTPNVEHSYDMILEGEDYTIGYLLEYYIHSEFYNSDENDLDYIGFKKYHPHDDYSVLRFIMTKNKNAGIHSVSGFILEASKNIIKTFKDIQPKFEKR
jgi:DNA-directed RNA polymerase subunit L